MITYTSYCSIIDANLLNKTLILSSDIELPKQLKSKDYLKHLKTYPEDYRRLISKLSYIKRQDKSKTQLVKTILKDMRNQQSKIDIKTETKNAKKAITESINNIKKHTSVSKEHLAKALKQKDVFNVIKQFGFSLGNMGKAVLSGTDLLRKGILGLSTKVSNTKTGLTIRENIHKVDEFFDEHPKLKKVTGVAVAGLLTYGWLNMSFMSDLDYDVDISSIGDALTGDFNLHDLFAGPEGIMFLNLLALGLIGGPSFSWLGGTGANIGLALAYTGSKKLKPIDVNALKQLAKEIPLNEPVDKNTFKKLKNIMKDMAKEIKKGKNTEVLGLVNSSLYDLKILIKEFISTSPYSSLIGKKECKGYCDTISTFLGIFLKEKGIKNIKKIRVESLFLLTSTESKNHSIIKVGDIIIDLTWKQFEFLQKETKPYFIGNERVYKKFFKLTKDEQVIVEGRKIITLPKNVIKVLSAKRILKPKEPSWSSKLPKYWFRGFNTYPKHLSNHVSTYFFRDRTAKIAEKDLHKDSPKDLIVNLYNRGKILELDGLHNWNFKITRKYSGMSNWGYGIYFSQNLDWAMRYGKFILVCMINPKDILSINADDFSDSISKTTGNYIREEISKNLGEELLNTSMEDQMPEFTKVTKKYNRSKKALYVGINEEKSGQLVVYTKNIIFPRYLMMLKD